MIPLLLWESELMSAPFGLCGNPSIYKELEAIAGGAMRESYVDQDAQIASRMMRTHLQTLLV